ncbi:hypothetical protein [Aestuariivita boseongensis]|uniref:hypothetical protein n=1 Tax=Aestuariivita boseongensis TaxID=1470562 RepID=UPI0012FCD277|nr:hypothetical protein [Aestuariivita boseongensis]
MSDRLRGRFVRSQRKTRRSKPEVTGILLPDENFIKITPRTVALTAGIQLACAQWRLLHFGEI